MELVCIVCPNSCRLTVENHDGQVSVSGNKCKRGEVFANSELTNPMRSATTSVKTTVLGYPVVSVKTDGEIPKSKLFELMQLCDEIVIDKPLPIGTVLVDNLFGTNAKLVTTTDMEDTNE